MKSELVDLLLCPKCGKHLSAEVSKRIDDEIITGRLRCDCGNSLSIVRGILRCVGSDDYVGNFSFEWQLHRTTQLDSQDNRQSTQAFCEKTRLRPEEYSGKRVLDVGVGTGRFADVLLKAGAEVVGIDLSYAVETAMENVGQKPACNVVQANLFRLPFREPTFDLIYSIGVLHHTPDCRKAFHALLPYLRPGGTIVIWLYSAHTWTEGSLLETMNRFWRSITTRLPCRLLYFLCLCELPLYFLRKIPGFDRFMHLLLPGFIYHAIPKFNDSKNIKEHILDAFDWYSPRYQSKHTYPEVFEWFREAGLEEIRVLPYPVTVSGRMPERDQPEVPQEEDRQSLVPVAEGSA